MSTFRLSGKTIEKDARRLNVLLNAVAGGAGVGVGGGGADNRVTLWQGASSLKSDANLYFDSTNDRLGIGTASPGSALDVEAGAVGDVVIQTRAIAGQTADLFRAVSSAGATLTLIDKDGNVESGTVPFNHRASGYQLAPNGSIECNDLEARGSFQASVFTYETVNATSGALMVAEASTLAANLTLGAGPGLTDTISIPFFSVDLTDVEIGDTVTFTSAVKGAVPTEYLWDVDGDGVVDYTTQNCTHEYTAEGTYSPILTTISAGGTVSQQLYNHIIVRPTIVVTDYVTDGLIHLWEFDDGTGFLVRDTGPAKHNLVVNQPANVTWGDGSLIINTGVVLANAELTTDTILINAVKASGALSICACVTPSLSAHTAARLISLAGDTYDTVNFAVSNRETGYPLRLRSVDGDYSGLPSLDMDVTRAVEKQHIAFTISAAGAWKWYLNNVVIASGSLSGATGFSVWDDDYLLTLADGILGDRPFLGTLHGIAIYSKELSAAEVEQNFNAEGGVDEGFVDVGAAFHSDIQTVASGGTVTFTDDSTGDIATYLWSFGDGTTSTVAAPTHVYTSAVPVKRTVSLYLTGRNGSTDTETKYDYISVTVGGVEGEANKFIAKNGSDANPGTEALPWKTLARAAQTGALVAGDILMVKEGVYQEAPVFTCTGTAANPITIVAEPNKSVVIDGNNYATNLPVGTARLYWPGPPARSATDTAIVRLTGSYTTFSGFEIRYSWGRGILVDGNNNTAENLTIHHLRNNAVQVAGSNATVDNCTCYETANYCPIVRAPTDYNWPGTIQIREANYVTIKNCTCYHNYGSGILVWRTKNTTVEDNVCGKNLGTGINVTNASNTTVQRNFVYGEPKNDGWLTVSSVGLVIGVEDEGVTWPCTDNLIINNIVVGGRTCLNSTVEGSSMGYLVNTTIANNVFYEATGTTADDACVRLVNHPANSNSVVKNNIIKRSTGTLIILAKGTTGVTYDYNCWSSLPVTAAQGAHDVLAANPGFLNPDPVGTCAKDPTRYRISTGSPCHEEGVTLADVTDDFWGTARAGDYDIGAHEA